MSSTSRVPREVPSVFHSSMLPGGEPPVVPAAKRVTAGIVRSSQGLEVEAGGARGGLRGGAGEQAAEGGEHGQRLPFRRLVFPGVPMPLLRRWAAGVTGKRPHPPAPLRSGEGESPEHRFSWGGASGGFGRHDAGRDQGETVEGGRRADSRSRSDRRQPGHGGGHVGGLAGRTPAGFVVPQGGGRPGRRPEEMRQGCRGPGRMPGLAVARRPLLGHGWPACRAGGCVAR
jgi:hypothetical protein